MNAFQYLKRARFTPKGVQPFHIEAKVRQAMALELFEDRMDRRGAAARGSLVVRDMYRNTFLINVRGNRYGVQATGEIVGRGSGGCRVEGEVEMSDSLYWAVLCACVLALGMIVLGVAAIIEGRGLAWLPLLLGALMGAGCCAAGSYYMWTRTDRALRFIKEILKG